MQVTNKGSGCENETLPSHSYPSKKVSFYIFLSFVLGITAIAGSYYSICIFVRTVSGFYISPELALCGLLSARFGYVAIKELIRSVPMISEKSELDIHHFAYADSPLGF